MKFSKFNLWLEDYPEKGDSLVFNSRTQALIKIEERFRRDLAALVDSPEAAVGPDVRDSLAGLRENGILVADDKEEETKTKDFFRQLKEAPISLPFEVTLLTTYACNFRCTYCFEASVRESVFLDQATAGEAVRWIRDTVERLGMKRLFLVYYGGEPLLNPGPVHDVSQQLAAWAQQHGVAFGFGVITNGSLVTPELVDRLTAVGLKEMRITVDGDRQAHDRRRPFADGRPSFDLIIENIKAVVDRVGVQLCGNVDGQNLESLPRLVDLLEKEGLLRKLQSVDFVPIQPRLGPKHNPAAIELGECLRFTQDEGLFRALLAIKRDLMRRGAAVRTGLAINACSLITRGGGVAIDPHGMIYKCNALLGYPEFAAGRVTDAEPGEPFVDFTDVDAWDKCPQDCPYLPMCQGGCRFFAYLEHGDFAALSCKREYLDRIIPELIKLEYERLRTAGL